MSRALVIKWVDWGNINEFETVNSPEHTPGESVIFQLVLRNKSIKIFYNL